MPAVQLRIKISLSLSLSLSLLSLFSLSSLSLLSSLVLQTIITDQILLSGGEGNILRRTYLTVCFTIVEWMLGMTFQLVKKLLLQQSLMVFFARLVGFSF